MLRSRRFCQQELAHSQADGTRLAEGRRSARERVAEAQAGLPRIVGAAAISWAKGGSPSAWVAVHHSHPLAPWRGCWKINCAQRLALDVLLGKQQGSVVRSWLGDRDMAIAMGGTLDGAFDRSFCEITRDWCVS